MRLYLFALFAFIFCMKTVASDIKKVTHEHQQLDDKPKKGEKHPDHNNHSHEDTKHHLRNLAAVTSPVPTMLPTMNPSTCPGLSQVDITALMTTTNDGINTYNALTSNQLTAWCNAGTNLCSVGNNKCYYFDSNLIQNQASTIGVSKNRIYRLIQLITNSIVYNDPNPTIILQTYTNAILYLLLQSPYPTVPNGNYNVQQISTFLSAPFTGIRQMGLVPSYLQFSSSLSNLLNTV